MVRLIQTARKMSTRNFLSNGYAEDSESNSSSSPPHPMPHANGFGKQGREEVNDHPTGEVYQNGYYGNGYHHYDDQEDSLVEVPIQVQEDDTWNNPPYRWDDYQNNGWNNP